MLTTRVLAPNPGPMTLEGTNTFIVRRPDSHRVAVVDPGPLDRLHLRDLVSNGLIELILLTHNHQDHCESARRLSDMTGAPVRAIDPNQCMGSGALADGEELFAGGARLTVLATPGHSVDSACFYLHDDRDLEGATPSGSMLTGDTILGRGTTTIAAFGGSLRAYMASLERLISFGSAIVLPGHGDRLDDLAVVVRGYLAHRHSRLQDVSTAVNCLRSQRHRGSIVAGVTDLVYPRVAPGVRMAAEATVRAQLDYVGESDDVAGVKHHSPRNDRG